MESVASSLANLRATYLECLVLHSLYPGIQDSPMAWRAMEDLVPSKSNPLGLSNIDLESLRRSAAWPGLTVVKRWDDSSKRNYCMPETNEKKRYEMRITESLSRSSIHRSILSEQSTPTSTSRNQIVPGMDIIFQLHFIDQPFALN